LTARPDLKNQSFTPPIAAEGENMTDERDDLPPSRHDLNPRFRIKEARLQTISAKLNPPHMIGFMESMN
jgi:hypothetical protein